MTTHDARIEDGRVVLTPEQAAELGLREGDALTVTIARNRFTRWIGTLPPLPGDQDSRAFYRQLRDGEE